MYSSGSYLQEIKKGSLVTENQTTKLIEEKQMSTDHSKEFAYIWKIKKNLSCSNKSGNKFE